MLKKIDDNNKMKLLINTCLLLLLSLFSVQVLAQSGKVDIKAFKATALDNNQYVVNATISFQLSETQQQALLHGVKLNVNIDMALGEHRVWWWNSLKLVSRISYELKYHALSKHYIVKQLNMDKHWSFTSLPSALKYIGKVEDYRLPAFHENIQDGQHYLYLAAKIDVETRSLPLKIQSYFKNSKYYAESEGVLWALP